MEESGLFAPQKSQGLCKTTKETKNHKETQTNSFAENGSTELLQITINNFRCSLSNPHVNTYTFYSCIKDFITTLLRVSGS